MAHDKLTISLPIYKPMKHLKEVCNTYLNIFFLCAKCTDENESTLTAIRRSSRREKKSLSTESRSRWRTFAKQSRRSGVHCRTRRMHREMRVERRRLYGR